MGRALRWGMRLSLPADLPPGLVSYRRALIFLANLLLIPLAYLAAFAIRFDFHIPAWEWDRYLATLPYLVIVRLIVFERYGLFRGYWRHVGMRDLVDLGTATTLSTSLFAGVLLVVGWPTGMPRSVFVLDWLNMVFLSGGVGLVKKKIREGELKMQERRGGRRK